MMDPSSEPTKVALKMVNSNSDEFMPTREQGK